MDGRTPQQLLEDYERIEKENKKLHKTITRLTQNYEQERTKLRTKLKDLMQKLKEQQDRVIKPLIIEMKCNEQLN